MIQQFIALVIIIFFLVRLLWQKKNNKIKGGEFNFWLIFWIISAVAVLFIKQIDTLVASIGFSGSGIEVLLYMAVVILFYFIFRLRLRISKIETDITRIVRGIAIDNNKQDNTNKD